VGHAWGERTGQETETGEIAEVPGRSGLLHGPVSAGQQAWPEHADPGLAKFEREARERLGPDATDRQVAEAAESARRAHYARMGAAGVTARRKPASA